MNDMPTLESEGSEYILLPEQGARAMPGQPLFVGSMSAQSTAAPRRITFGWPQDRTLREGVLFLPEQPPAQEPSPQTLPADYTFATVEVIDAPHEDWPKLIRASDEVALALRAHSPVIRLAPIREYSPMEARVYAPSDLRSSLPVQLPETAHTSPSITIRVESAGSGTPISGAEVIALTDARLRLGDQGVTDTQGHVSLRLGANTIEELYVEPPTSGHWGAFQRGVRHAVSHVVTLEPVDLSFAKAPDSLRHFYGTSPPGGDGNGVRVAVIDTGIETTHPDLGPYLGRNTVTGEPDADQDDNGLGHGTHVAGIIAARGTAPNGISGLAPSVDLRNYRAYGARKTTATNYAIQKAILYACNDDCHLINLSLGGVPPDETLREAVADARDHGALVICAAGNAGRQPVTVPACYGLAVTALGRKGTFPTGAREEADIAAPAGSDPDDFVAGFSNVGVDVDFIAPGVGIVSTVPGGGYAPRRGTSMAAAAATGMAARLLSAQPTLLNRPGDADRAAAVQNYLNSCARSKGFALQFEGYGMM